MGNDLLYMLLRASIAASLSDRELFIEKVSKVIEERMHRDPESARYISDQIAGAMEGLNGTLMIKQLFGQRQDKKLNQTLEQLTLSIDKLNALLEEAGLSAELSNSEEK